MGSGLGLRLRLGLGLGLGLRLRLRLGSRYCMSHRARVASRRAAACCAWLALALGLRLG